MKRLFLLTAVVALVTASCGNVNNPSLPIASRGLITGPDLRKCSSICCGGWYIDIGNQTYHFLKLPANTNLNLNEATYPIPVLLLWSPADSLNFCSDDIIIVHAIQKQ